MVPLPLSLSGHCAPLVTSIFLLDEAVYASNCAELFRAVLSFVKPCSTVSCRAEIIWYGTTRYDSMQHDTAWLEI